MAYNKIKQMNYTLIVGLGNPGEEYENTYHNVGFLALLAAKKSIEAAATETEAPFERYKNSFEYAKCGALAFVRPLTFMNESGRAVREAARMFHAKPDEIFVLHDDSDLTVGAIKISVGQNAAGHHGVESIIESLGSNEFTRARIGIRPANEVIRKKAGEFVLKPIKKSDHAALEKVFEEIIKKIKAE